MGDLLFLLYSLMKVGLVVGVMVLVATAPLAATASSTARGQGASWFTDAVGTPSRHHIDDRSLGYVFAEDDTVAAQQGLHQFDLIGAAPRDDEPDHWRNGSEYESPASPGMEPDLFEHSINVDGTPMCGAIDINGNVYGITESHFDSWAYNDMSSMFD